MVDRVASIEKSLGIYDLAQFTPKWTADVKRTVSLAVTYRIPHSGGITA
jgi:hypothetical protein